MKAFNTTLQAVIVAAACLAGAPALAQHAGHEHGKQVAGAAADTTEAEVRKVDKAARKMTLKHGELKNLGMGPMTMVFRVKDAALLDKVKAGDRARVTIENVDSALTVTAIETVK